MFGPQEDQEGACNAILSLGDDFGDNTCTIKCHLPEGHEGPHKEEFHREGGLVTITYSCDERPRSEKIEGNPTLEIVLEELKEDRPEFSHWSLSKLSLSNIDFGCSFGFEVKASECEFFQSKFGGYFFTHCNLFTVDLSKAVFEADEHSDQIKFDFAKMYNVRFLECDLRKASFKYASLDDMHFLGADLRDVDFSECRYLGKLDLRHANVEGAIFPCRFDAPELDLDDLVSRGAIIKDGTYILDSGTYIVRGDRCLQVSTSTRIIYPRDANAETARRVEILKSLNWNRVRFSNEDRLLREIEEKTIKDRRESFKYAFGSDEDDEM